VLNAALAQPIAGRPAIGPLRASKSSRTRPSTTVNGNAKSTPGTLQDAEDDHRRGGERGGMQLPTAARGM
jgi:hypothetical protein